MAKRYTVRDIERLTRLSPNTIKEFLNIYHKQLFPDRAPEEGSEVTLDQAGFERLLFIKQLALHLRLSQDEIAQQLGALRPREIARPLPSLPEPAATPTAETAETPGQAWVRLTKTVTRLTEQVRDMSAAMQDVLQRYTRVLTDLHAVTAENRQLKIELQQLKRNQANIVAELRMNETLDALVPAGAAQNKAVN